MSEDRSKIDEAIAFLRLASEAEATNRAEGMEDLRFVDGEQWEPTLIASRTVEQRPCLTINKLDGYCRQVSNNQRQQRPRIKVHPVNGYADKKIADVIQGMIRHIETNSNADTAYDTAFDYAVKIGWGYFRIDSDYCREDSFDQELYINAIENPFQVYFDPNSVEPDGSDAKKCLITKLLSKEQFRKEYPDADDMANFTHRGTGDMWAQWVTKDDIRVAEFYYLKEEPARLMMLSDGNVMFEDVYKRHKTIIEGAGVEIVAVRDSHKRKLHWCKLTASEILEERELPGRFIPVVPVYGNLSIVDGKRKRYGLVRFGKDPQRMINYWETAATESIALAPKAKWLIAEGQDEGHENEWSRANISAMATLRYKQTDIDGQPAPPPQRLQPEPPPVGILQALQLSTDNLREVIGIVDPAQRIQGNVSGKALVAEKIQSDNATFHYYDNLTRSLAHAGRIILDLIPHYYDTEREMRIIGDDGKPNIVVINGKQQTAEGEVLNDVTVGQYDVIMDTGPGYQSKRQQAVDSLAPLMENPQMLNLIGDLFFRNSDFPGAEVIADRLAAMNPLAQIDEQADIPPGVQIKIKQMQQQMQQMQQQLQAAAAEIKFKAGIEQMKQQEETKREMMRATVKAHDTETWANENIQQTQMDVATRHKDMELKALSAQHVAEINGMTQLLVKGMDAKVAELDRLSDEEHKETQKEFRE